MPYIGLAKRFFFHKKNFAQLVMSDSLRPQGPQPQRLLYLWDFPGEDTEVGYHFLLQEIFLTQESNPHLLLGRQILYHSATCTCHEMVQKNLNEIFGQPIIYPFYIKKGINAVILFFIIISFFIVTGLVMHRGQ